MPASSYLSPHIWSLTLPLPAPLLTRGARAGPSWLPPKALPETHEHHSPGARSGAAPAPAPAPSRAVPAPRLPGCLERALSACKGDRVFLLGIGVVGGPGAPRGGAAPSPRPPAARHAGAGARGARRALAPEPRGGDVGGLRCAASHYPGGRAPRSVAAAFPFQHPNSARGWRSPGCTSPRGARASLRFPLPERALAALPHHGGLGGSGKCPPGSPGELLHAPLCPSASCLNPELAGHEGGELSRGGRTLGRGDSL